MAEAQLNGITVHYEDSGSGLVVFMTHGYAAAGRMWEPQRKPLNEAGYRLVSWDMRGHGETESPDDPAQYSEALTIADMAALMDMLGIERAVVGGLSLGGFMSLAFQLAHPERVRALLLCDTGPGYRSDEARAKWNRMAEKSAVNFEAKGLDAAGTQPGGAGGREVPQVGGGARALGAGDAGAGGLAGDRSPAGDRRADADHRGGEGRAVPRRLAVTCSRRFPVRGSR